ncbi:MAG TPA: hypothetical protein VFZ81_09935 [Burkholderiales bacterium]
MTPLALWTHVLLKGGEAMLDTMQAAVKRARPDVAVIPTADAPQPAARPKAPARRAQAQAKPKPKRKARARSAKSSARRR